MCLVFGGHDLKVKKDLNSNPIDGQSHGNDYITRNT